MPQAIDNPLEIKVQLNTQVTWAWREFLRAHSQEQKISLNALVRNALEAEYGEAFLASQGPVPYVPRSEHREAMIRHIQDEQRGAP